MRTLRAQIARNLFLISMGCWLLTPAEAQRSSPISETAPMNYTAIFSRPPQHVPTEFMPDGPLLGNGDVGVSMAGPPEAQTFYIGKNDFWRRNPGDASIVAVGSVELSIPALRGATYYQEQDLTHAEVRGTFEKDGGTLKTSSRVDANSNLLVTSVNWNGKAPIQLTITQKVAENGGLEAGGDPKLLRFTRKADSLPGHSREVAVSTRVLGEVDAANASPGIQSTLRPGETTYVVTAILSDRDSKSFKEDSARRVTKLGPASIATILAKHRIWWQNFWAKSFIEIPDKEIEKRWYAALYVMGSSSRAGKVAPGLWGNWITTDHPAWHGDFHLNYNFQAPFYIVYSSNHPELSLPFYQAIWESVPNGEAMAMRHGWKGVHFPVCIGPWGLSPENPDQDWGQRSDAVYAAISFIWQYQFTQDREFLRKTAYPYLRLVADFWEDYLKFESGRYVIYNDSIHEGSGSDMNPLLSLGLVRNLFQNLIPMSEELGLDADRRAKWQDICEHLSDFPTQIRHDKTVFRYSERGMAWNDGNTLGIQHIFPSGAIGLNSDPKLIEISRQTIDEMARWSDGNGFSSWYTACARVGIDPKLILSKLRAECDEHSMPNLVLSYGGGGIENVSGFLAINEMLMQSHEGMIRLFPDWPRDEDARFGGLRAVGAFLVSGEIKGGSVREVKIFSERGLECTVENPWPGKSVVMKCDGKPSKTLVGERFNFPTRRNETITLDIAESHD